MFGFIKNLFAPKPLPEKMSFVKEEKEYIYIGDGMMEEVVIKTKERNMELFKEAREARLYNNDILKDHLNKLKKNQKTTQNVSNVRNRSSGYNSSSSNSVSRSDDTSTYVAAAYYSSPSFSSSDSYSSCDSSSSFSGSCD